MFGPRNERKGIISRQNFRKVGYSVGKSVDEEKIRTPKTKESLLNYLVYFLIKLIIVAVVIYVLFFKVVGFYKVVGNGMFPRVLDGDLLLYSRISKDLHSDDILVYDVGGKVYVGRMKARGGDVVDISETGEFLINGAVQAEEIFYPTEKDVDSDIEYPLTVREGYYFILSDFRTNCEDSRILGDVSEENIKGKVISMFRRRGF